MLWPYALFGAAVAFAGPPIYIHTPNLYASQHGITLGALGAILLGVGLGHSGLELFSEEDVTSLVPVTDFALGLIAVTVGGHLNLRRMGGARRRLGLMLLAESTITPALLYVACVGGLGTDWRTAMLLSALAVSTAPATVVALGG